MLKRPFPLDMVPGGVPLQIHVSQYDSDEQIVFSLFSSQGILDVPTVHVTAKIRGTKLDGNGISNDAVLTFVNNVPTVTVQVTQQMTAIAGKNPFEIVLTAMDLEEGVSYELPSATFYLIVKRAALDYDTLGSQSDIAEIADVLHRADELISAADDIQEAAALIAAGEAATSADIERLDDEIDSLSGRIEDLSRELSTKVDGGYVSEGAFNLVTDGSGTLGPFSGMGGGGGPVSTSDLMVLNTTGWTAVTIAAGSSCVLSLNWTSTEDTYSTGNGTLTVRVNGTSKANMNVPQGKVQVDVKDFINTGENTVSLTITDSTGNYKTRTFTITVISLYLISSFDETVIQNSSFSFAYVPYGAVAKTVYFVIDGDTANAESITTSVSGRQLTYTVPALTHGAHSLEVFIKSTINGEVITSNSLYYEFIYVTAGGTAPIISTSWHTASVDQYATVSIPFMVYTPGEQYSDVVISLNGKVASEVTVDRTKQYFSSRLSTAGSNIITFASGNTTRTLTITVNELNIDVHAETDSLLLHLSSAGRSNNEANPGTWQDTDHGVSCDFSGFNYSSDGWIADDDGVVALKIMGDARLSIPYKIFSSDFRSTGATIELEFSTEDVLDYDAPIISCTYGGRGLVVTPQSCILTSEQSSISMQYKEDEHVRVGFVVEKSSGLRRMYCYINGIISGCIQYAADDDFQQTTPVGISVGSSNAAVNLYCIRVYGSDLSSEQMVDNWIADTQDGATMVERYVRNKIYDEYGSIQISKLPLDLPYMIIECAELPQYKGDKKTVSGSYTDPSNTARSFTFIGAEANVQGTSSQYYARKNYKIKFKNGFLYVETGQTAKTFQLSNECVATNTFCFKADVASSEGANNVELVRLYCKTCPYQTPAQEENPLVRQGIDGFPIVIFWYDTVNDVTIFLGKYNFNLDKGTEECYGFVEGDESWEISNNTSSRTNWKDAHYGVAYTDSEGTYHEADEWLNDFEARYPDTDPPYQDPVQLAEFAAWVVSTDPDQATGAALPRSVTYDETTYTSDTEEYRLAKFRAELPDYTELDSALFYYLFTELFLMVDSRAKNMFPSFIGSEIEEAGA